MTKEIPLTQGKVALVDDEDYARVSQIQWMAYCPNQHRGSTTFYAQGKNQASGETIQMHRFVNDTSEDAIVDHRDGDGLNNQKHNLRKCANFQNLHNRGRNKNNTSGFKGVTFDRRAGRWKSAIQVDKHRVTIGYFDTPEAAARAYDAKAKDLMGEFAKLNFPQS